MQIEYISIFPIDLNFIQIDFDVYMNHNEIELSPLHFNQEENYQ